MLSFRSYDSFFPPSGSDELRKGHFGSSDFRIRIIIRAFDLLLVLFFYCYIPRC